MTRSLRHIRTCVGATLVLVVALIWSQTGSRALAQARPPQPSLPSHDLDASADNSGSQGSTYIPIDSWIYPAMDRLHALGYVDTAYLGLRPWTRLSIARMLMYSADRLETDTGNDEARSIYLAVLREVKPDLGRTTALAHPRVELESVYTVLRGIGGPSLRDSFHLGSTIVNDYGRPYAQGVNEVAGASGWATAGPLVGYARVEYQYAPSSPALPAAARLAIEQVDYLPVEPPDAPTPATSRVDLLEGYVGLQLKNWEISFGKQSEWWGPDQGGPMMFSKNAEPIVFFDVLYSTQ